jgi:hypothetical protein
MRLDVQRASVACVELLHQCDGPIPIIANRYFNDRH